MKKLLCILFIVFIFGCSINEVEISKYKITDNTLITIYYGKTEVVNFSPFLLYNYSYYLSEERIGNIYSFYINDTYMGRFLEKDSKKIIKFLKLKQKEYYENIKKCPCKNYN
jgi:hypothetical protein